MKNWRLRSINSGNDVDDRGFFVEQQYRDFLAREADDSGLGFWIREIERCGADDPCVRRMRVNWFGPLSNQPSTDNGSPGKAPGVGNSTRIRLTAPWGTRAVSLARTQAGGA